MLRTMRGEIDPVVDRSIRRCLSPDPSDRPESVAVVSASLPGGDPIAAALAAGETPSPALIAASATPETLSIRLAIFACIFIVVGSIVALFLSSKVSLLNQLGPILEPAALRNEARGHRAIGVFIVGRFRIGI